jgi:uncharacterized protein YyaL (SSP411 family)
MEEVLGDENAALAQAIFCDNGTGKYSVPRNGGTGMILRRTGALESIARHHRMTTDELAEKIGKIRSALFSAQQKRPRPARDDKVLADWNGFVIVALAKAARAFGEQKYADAGQRAARFILDGMHAPGGGLFHRYRDGEAAIPAFADDYTSMVWGLVELYEATFDYSHITAATELNRYFIDHFEDGEHGGFFTTADTAEQVLVRKKEVYDGAAPSCNSVALLNLLRLAHLTGNYQLEKTASALSQSFSAMVKCAPSGSAFFLCALDYAFGPSFEVVIAGDLRQPDTRALVKVCQTHFLPSVMVLFQPVGDLTSSPLTTAGSTVYPAREGKATAYVCSRQACISPVTNPDDLQRVMGVRQPEDPPVE